MNNYEAPYGVIFGFIAIALFTSGMGLGSVVSEGRRGTLEKPAHKTSQNPPDAL